MTGKSEWERFFDGHAPHYFDNVFTKATVEEVDFIIEELGLKPGVQILDMGCGAGRHSVELARRGYKMTGVDLSQGMLDQAEQLAKEAGVKIELIKCDATRFVPDREYDGAICLCEGAFSLLGLDDGPFEHDMAILHNINKALKPNAKLILTALNGMTMIRQYSSQDIADGKFDPITMTEHGSMEWEEDGEKRAVYIRERGYVPTELVLMLHNAGFDAENVWGGTAGNWGRRPIDPDEIEIMVTGRKKIE